MNPSTDSENLAPVARPSRAAEDTRLHFYPRRRAHLPSRLSTSTLGRIKSSLCSNGMSPKRSPIIPLGVAQNSSASCEDESFQTKMNMLLNNSSNFNKFKEYIAASKEKPFSNEGTCSLLHEFLDHHLRVPELQRDNVDQEPSRSRGRSFLAYMSGEHSPTSSRSRVSSVSPTQESIEEENEDDFSESTSKEVSSSGSSGITSNKGGDDDSSMLPLPGAQSLSSNQQAWSSPHAVEKSTCEEDSSSVCSGTASTFLTETSDCEDDPDTIFASKSAVAGI